ncbi:MAG: DMT family transporter [Bacteroidota bacterium]
MDSTAANSRKSYVLLATLALIWGSSFILMRVGLSVYTPQQIGCLRMLFAAVVMSPFLFSGFKSVQPRHWKYLLATGVFGNAIPSILFPLAQTGISSALAGMINTLTPIFTVLLGAAAFGMIVPRSSVYGLLTGFAGAIMLIAGGNGTLHASSPLYPFLVVAATVCYAISVNVLRHGLAGLHPLTITSFALLFIGLPMGSYLLTTDFVARTLNGLSQPATISGNAMLSFNGISPFALGLFAIFLLGVLGTAVSTVMFNRLIQLSGAMVASSVTYLIPLVATCWGFSFGEKIEWLHLGGLALVLTGVYLINQRRG